MKNILLVCAVGMSSSILVNRMIKAASEKDEDILVHACGMGDIDKFIDEVNLLLIGPQIAYVEGQLKKDYGERLSLPIKIISSKDYQTMNGARVLEEALQMIEQA
ncbi:PTS sugar transporter subunit IIB [Amphibacillus cookii]|uniref:PTS sugar transporter subunit IIB n=1 Tax=Amphibacillus cookii TaxID=767787 RepID=UPI00195785A7|nr:PTS sugar transporter subunit IIB [Amphibacillus cookii]MBM7540312.1 PTS system cellobiose-specific IIB component [Amphibacillus cookii]